MCRVDKIEIRKFSFEDIPLKIDWINNTVNNKYLHYDLPLEYEKTVAWYNKIKNADTRYDATVIYNGKPVGLVGLLNIDTVNLKAEYYICLGEDSAKGKGVATVASKMLIKYAFETLKLNKIYLYTEEANVAAQKLFERLGFVREGFLKEDIIYRDKKINRFAYALLKEGADYDF